MSNLFYSDGRALHEAVIAAYGAALEVVNSREALDGQLAKGEGLVILDAEYFTASGYAICEDIKRQYGERWRVHLLSNEASVGEAEKADYACVDRLFIVPLQLDELLLA